MRGLPLVCVRSGPCWGQNLGIRVSWGTGAVMTFETLQDTFISYGRLLEADTLGSFDFFTCIICLDSIDSGCFENMMEARKNEDYLYLSKLVPLLVHEFTHFIDSTSTVWGMNHLRKMNDAYCSNDGKGGSENDFYKAKLFLDHVRSLRLPSYYTLVEENNRSSRPWQSNITMGKQFDLDGKVSEVPILFSRFTNHRGELLARSPVSTVSLLEASAMSVEMVARLGLINELGDDARIVEQARFEKEALDYIYNKNITEYSVCVHIVANQLQCKDLFVAFGICSTISRLVLNFPKALIPRILEVAKLHDILGVPGSHELAGRAKVGVESHDLGILYYLICCALPKDSADTKEKFISGLEIALSELGVSVALLIEEATREVEQINEELQVSGLDVIKVLSQAGIYNFREIPFFDAGLDLSNLALPSVYLGDGAEVRVFGREGLRLNDLGLDEIFGELYEGQEWVERFSEACIA